MACIGDVRHVLLLCAVWHVAVCCGCHRVPCLLAGLISHVRTGHACAVTLCCVTLGGVLVCAVEKGGLLPVGTGVGPIHHRDLFDRETLPHRDVLDPMPEPDEFGAGTRTAEEPSTTRHPTPCLTHPHMTYQTREARDQTTYRSEERLIIE